MNKITLSVAGIAIVITATIVDAQARGAGGSLATAPRSYTPTPGWYTPPGASFQSAGRAATGTSGAVGGRYSLPGAHSAMRARSNSSSTSTYSLPGVHGTTSMPSSGAAIMMAQASAKVDAPTSTGASSATGTKNAHATTFGSSVRGAGVVSGYSLPGTANGVSGGLGRPTPLHRNANGSLAHGISPGSPATSGSMSRLTSQSMLSNSSPGIGNSEPPTTAALPKLGLHAAKACVGATGSGVSCN